jgi:hypothetical protein
MPKLISRLAAALLFVPSAHAAVVRPSPSAPVSPAQYGAACDGITDDSATLTAWAAGAVNGSMLYIPGNCVFKSALTFAAVNNVTLYAEGHNAQLTYAGTATTGPLVTIGATVSGCSTTGWTIRGLRIMSNTVMTGNAGLRINDMCQADIENIAVGDGIGGNANLFNGVRFNGGNSIHMRGYAFQASNIAEIINGDPGFQFTDMYQSQGVISHSGIGLNIAGNVGGFNVSETDILLNGTNVLVDQSQVASPNLQIFFGSGVVVDATSGGAGVGLDIRDAGGSNSVFISTGVWYATAANQCILLETGVSWYFLMNGGKVYNCQGDGFKSNTTTSNINITGTYFGNNARWAINGAVANPTFNIWNVTFGATPGGAFSPNINPVSYTNASQIPVLNGITSLTGPNPSLRMQANGAQPANQKNWDFYSDSGGGLHGRAVTDNYGAANDFFSVLRVAALPTLFTLYEPTLLTPTTIVGLPACTGGLAGTVAFVHDTTANAPATFHGVVTGGGATTVNSLVSCNGAGWQYD